MPRAKLDPSGTFLRHPLKPHQLVDRVTRTEDTIVLCHLGVARVDADDWSLSIDGLVRRPLRLSFSELKRHPRVDVASVHQCCGSPLQPEEPKRRVCNVVWSGVRLKELMADCQPDPAARFVWSSGADHGAFEGVSCDAFVKDLPLDRVAADVLVALAMNDAPLSPENGFPARLVVPGFYGTNSVKWLTRLTLAANRATGPFATRWYNDPIRDASGQPTGATSPVWSIAPESVIVSPAPDQVLAAGAAVEIWGWAWADGGIARVEVSVDGASQWMQAVVEPSTGRTWQRFAVAWHPSVRENTRYARVHSRLMGEPSPCRERATRSIASRSGSRESTRRQRSSSRPQPRTKVSGPAGAISTASNPAAVSGGTTSAAR